MKKMRAAIITLLCCMVGCQVFADEVTWKNDLRTKFLNNETVIMEINIRSFNSKDNNNDGFIQESQGEIRGNFLNAIDRLDEIKNLGINTLHVLPITPVGKIKALGTAGSLYSAAGFDTINEDLCEKKSKLTPEEQVKKFIEEAHKRGIRVIIDIPACGSYDLYLQRPDLFVTAQTNEPIIPADWTDVRLLATGTEEKIDSNVYNLYKESVKKMQELGFDGIRADVAHSKTALFWKKLIEYSRKNDPEFMWLAESSESWHDSISDYAVFTAYDKLLDAGFDGYYGSFFNLKEWKTAKDFHEQIKFTLEQTKKFSNKKAVIGAFTTHDEVSPILLKGENFSKMIIWLNSTLPLNSYYVDGFQTGDDYLYPLENKLAKDSQTDDDIYFTHRGKIDIFNYSRKPGGIYNDIKKDFILGNNVKKSVLTVLNNGIYTEINTKNPKIFGYSYEYNKKRVVTLGNLNFSYPEKFNISVGKKCDVLPIKITNMPDKKRGKLSLVLQPGEIAVFILDETKTY